MEMPLLVQWISPARNALLLKASFHDAVPGIILSFWSTRLPPKDHRHQCTQALPSPVACPSAMPPGVLFFFVALAYSRNSSVVAGNFDIPAFCSEEIR